MDLGLPPGIIMWSKFSYVPTALACVPTVTPTGVPHIVSVIYNKKLNSTGTMGSTTAPEP